MMKPAIVLTCEHATAEVPPAYMPLFEGAHDLLDSHRGVDFGALHIAQELQTLLSCPLITASATRLLIDCNRSLKHPQCFSEITTSLSKIEKQDIIDTWYTPYRRQVIDLIQQYIMNNIPIWHYSIHSFTPQLHHTVRNADLALLYDPQRRSEKKLACHWQSIMRQTDPRFKIRRNYPYRGNSDGFTTALRQLLPKEKYVGIEVEINQKLVNNQQSLHDVTALLKQSIVLMHNTLIENGVWRL